MWLLPLQIEYYCEQKLARSCSIVIMSLRSEIAHRLYLTYSVSSHGCHGSWLCLKSERIRFTPILKSWLMRSRKAYTNLSFCLTTVSIDCRHETHATLDWSSSKSIPATLINWWYRSVGLPPLKTVFHSLYLSMGRIFDRQIAQTLYITLHVMSCALLIACMCY